MPKLMMTLDFVLTEDGQGVKVTSESEMEYDYDKETKTTGPEFFYMGVVSEAFQRLLHSGEILSRAEELAPEIHKMIENNGVVVDAKT